MTSEYYLSPGSSAPSIQQIDGELFLNRWEGEIPGDLQFVPEKAWEDAHGWGCTADFESHVIHRSRRYRVIVSVLKNDTEVRAWIYKVLREEDLPAVVDA